jgi:hypothetical protein
LIGLNTSFKNVGRPVVASPVVLESVAVRVSFHVRRAHRRGFVRLYGTVAPAQGGALVGFQLLRPGKSVNEGGTAVKIRASDITRTSIQARVPDRRVGGGGCTECYPVYGI